MSKFIIMVICLSIVFGLSSFVKADDKREPPIGLVSYCESLGGDQKACIFWQFECLDLVESQYFDDKSYEWEDDEDDIRAEMIRLDCLSKGQIHGYGDWEYDFKQVLECCHEKFNKLEWYSFFRNMDLDFYYLKSLHGEGSERTYTKEGTTLISYKVSQAKWSRNKKPWIKITGCYEVDCNRKRYRILYKTIYYSETRGEIIQSAGDSWNDSKPDDYTKALYKISCDKYE